MAVGRDLLVGGVIAPGASLISIPADLGTVRLLCPMRKQVMPQRCDLMIFCVVATGTFINIITHFQAGRLLGVAIHRIMSQHINHILGDQYFLANRAMASLCQTGMHAIRHYRLVHCCRMTLHFHSASAKVQHDGGGQIVCKAAAADLQLGHRVLTGCHHLEGSRQHSHRRSHIRQRDH